MKLLINYMEHVPQSIILNWVLSQKKLFFYLFFHKFFDNFSIQVDFNQVANNYWNKTMNMKKYFFILRAQILWKNCPLLGRSLLNVYDSCAAVLYILYCIVWAVCDMIERYFSLSVKVDFEFYIFIYSIHLNAAEMLNLLLF